MQLGQLQKIQPELIALGYQILAVSPDRPEKLRATVKKHTLDYVLLSDSRMEAARSLGIAYRVARPSDGLILDLQAVDECRLVAMNGPDRP